MLRTNRTDRTELQTRSLFILEKPQVGRQQPNSQNRTDFAGGWSARNRIVEL
jgi:hypothetical protein